MYPFLSIHTQPLQLTFPRLSQQHILQTAHFSYQSTSPFSLSTFPATLKMVALSKQASSMEQYHVKSSCYNTAFFHGIPVIDLSKPDSKHLLVKACQEFGFFKVVNHGVPTEFISKLESEAKNFFSLQLEEKEKASNESSFGSSFGYGHKKIGRNGDEGWIEYLLFNREFNFERFSSILGVNHEDIQAAVYDYVLSVRNMACEIVEKLADGLNIEKNTFSKLLKDEQSDSVFRVNYYPPNPDMHVNKEYVGFGAHTDPQLISVLRSNNTSGLEIELKDGNWLPVPPDQSSFFVNVGDSMQVMTNGRFKSVKHKVMSNTKKSRLSMIYFGGPPLDEKIAPLPSVMAGGEDSLYTEFTWIEYKNSAYHTKLADNRLDKFQKKIAAN